MVIQKLKLHEWFLVYQLDQIKAQHSHMPFSVQLDISELASDYESSGIKLSYTALVLKIIGVWASANPTAHKMLFRSFLGFNFLTGDEIRVNLPIEIKHLGQSVVTAIVVTNPHLKSISQLAAEIKSAKSKSLDAFPITRFVYTKPNFFINRTILKFIHWVVFSYPNLYWKKGGGCISLSSLSNLSNKENPFSAFSYGPTGFTFFFKDVVKNQNKTYLNLSIGVDHNCYSGIEAINLINNLVSIFQSESREEFLPITRDV